MQEGREMPENQPNIIKLSETEYLYYDSLQTCTLEEDDLPKLVELLRKNYDVEEQTFKEYKRFSFFAKLRDFFMFKCKRYYGMEHLGGWTGIQSTGNRYSFPFGCFSTLTKGC
jgi:hypothetical protein